MLSSAIRLNLQHAKQVAVVLSGCGVYDGSEINEVVSVLLGLSRNGIKTQCFAPNIDQHHVINHTTGEEQNEKRNCLIESARITRGDIKELSELSSNNYDAIIVPGGFGMAKNLSSFAFKGESFTVNENLEKVLHDFKNNNKPIGLCCISPVIVAKVFPGCNITIGNDKDTSSIIKKLGSNNIEKSVTEICIDDNNKIVTTPAYMYGDAPIHQVYDGIQQMVTKTLSLIKE